MIGIAVESYAYAHGTEKFLLPETFPLTNFWGRSKLDFLKLFGGVMASRWVLNRKAFAAMRAIRADAPDRYKYIHVGPKGITATDTTAIVRVSLPATCVSPNVADLPEPRIFPLEHAKKLMPRGDDSVIMPEGLEAETTGDYTVPNFDVGIPDPQDQMCTITINANRLIDILKGAVEVTDHSRALVRLRLYRDNFIRVDSHRDNGGQEFMGMVMGTTYDGHGIPGDAPAGTTPRVTAETEKCEEGKLKLPVFEGRKFRDA
jgi:hypothetical protein